MANAVIENKALPESVSPKVKAAGVSGTVVTIALVVAAAALTAIPGGAFAGLGIWAAPVSAAVTTLAAVLSGYAKADPARNPNIITETVIAEPVATETEDTVATSDTDSETTEDGSTAGDSTADEVDEFERLNQAAS